MPLVHAGEEVGQLLVSPREAGEPLARADLSLLTSVAHQAGAAVHALLLSEGLQRLTTELQAARERLILAREEERRRLRHDLHDELAPTLAALSLMAARATDRLARDPLQAESLIAQLGASLRACVADVRRLAYDLRPPVLDELGLVAAIEERARQFSSDTHGRRLDVTVRVPAPLPALPAAVEVAAYRIALEALMNVVRHAGAQRCEVTLQASAAALEVRIVDDGVGLGTRGQAGVGLASMRERAGELGGACEIEAAPGGGTRVTAWLPIRPK